MDRQNKQNCGGNRAQHEEPPPPDEITTDEIKQAIKTLKRRKAVGPDSIPNELFIEADDQMITLIAKIMNIITQNYSIPDQWQHAQNKKTIQRKRKKKVNAHVKEV